MAMELESFHHYVRMYLQIRPLLRSRWGLIEKNTLLNSNDEAYFEPIHNRTKYGNGICDAVKAKIGYFRNEK